MDWIWIVNEDLECQEEIEPHRESTGGHLTPQKKKKKKKKILFASPVDALITLIGTEIFIKKKETDAF